jgi:hypothetical protein
LITSSFNLKIGSLTRDIKTLSNKYPMYIQYFASLTEN